MKRRQQLILLLFVCFIIAACSSLDDTFAQTDPTLPQQTTVNGEHSITGAPSISVAFINQVLCRSGSPVCGEGQTLYNIGVSYHIDPVWPLAIFQHESDFGTTGEARGSKSIGNLRCLDRAHYGDLGTWCQDGYAWFPSWQAGIEACYRLLAGPLYVRGGLTTIERIIPRWAPSSDGNDPAAYVASVLQSVTRWRLFQSQTGGTAK